jgi:predicted nucleic acid-binding protein
MPWVVDASSVVEVLLRTDLGTKVAGVLNGQDAHAPDLMNAEVLSTLRRLVAVGAMTQERAEQAVHRLSTAPIERVSTNSLIDELWSLRHSVTAYDACYVALARTLGCGIVTCDKRLSRAPNLGVPIVAL